MDLPKSSQHKIQLHCCKAFYLQRTAGIYLLHPKKSTSLYTKKVYKPRYIPRVARLTN